MPVVLRMVEVKSEVLHTALFGFFINGLEGGVNSALPPRVDDTELESTASQAKTEK